MDSFEAKGANGRLVITPEKITLIRKGALSLLTQGLKGDKEILVEDISSIQVRQPKFGTRGYIQFAYRGGQETKGGLIDAVKDENTLLFDKKHAADVMKAKELIERYRAEQRTAIHRPTPAALSDLDQLEKLAGLRDRGVLSQEEFDGKKKEILRA